jgi:hypothetical protein
MEAGEDRIREAEERRKAFEERTKETEVSVEVS